MARPFVDKSGVRLVHVSIKVTEAQREELRKRGGSEYVRRVLEKSMRVVRGVK